jgi:hypothetical protein
MERKRAAGIPINMDDFKTENKENKGTPSTKRKAALGPHSSSKKTKSGGPVKQPSASPDEDDEDDEDDDG